MSFVLRFTKTSFKSREVELVPGKCYIHSDQYKDCGMVAGAFLLYAKELILELCTVQNAMSCLSYD